MGRRISFLEEDHVIDQIDELAKARGSNRSTIIREAMRLFLSEYFLSKHGQEVKE